MAVLLIELQDGFDGDDVICTLDGREVRRLSDVRTSLVTALAAIVEVQAPDAGPIVVAVGVPARGLATEVVVRDPVHEHWVVVNVADGELEASIATELPPHM